MSQSPIALAIHGGAGPSGGAYAAPVEANLRGVAEVARDRLRAGGAAIGVAAEAVAALEAAGLYVAGRGSRPNAAGRYELDASLMDGATARAGAVAALEGFQSPIAAARAVMEATPHVLLAGAGAAAFAEAQGLARIANPATWFVRAADPPAPAPAPHGTVGCVALDSRGRLAAATSTGGVRGKLWGRVGDSPLIGAGTWADANVAVSCTGIGEYFIRTAAAAQLAFRVRAGEPLDAAATAVLAEVVSLGGEGGLIAVSAAGEIVMPFAAEGMRRAALLPSGEIVVHAA